MGSRSRKSRGRGRNAGNSQRVDDTKQELAAAATHDPASAAAAEASPQADGRSANTNPTTPTTKTSQLMAALGMATGLNAVTSEVAVAAAGKTSEEAVQVRLEEGGCQGWVGEPVRDKGAHPIDPGSTTDTFYIRNPLPRGLWARWRARWSWPLTTPMTRPPPSRPPPRAPAS
jgi:hypothetical protein